VPAAWDETRLLDGEPGKFAWWPGAWGGPGTWAASTARRGHEGDVPLDLLGNGTFDMLLLADGRTESSFLIPSASATAWTAQSVEMRPYGGFAMRLVPLN
jgi:alpha-glucosidase